MNDNDFPWKVSRVIVPFLVYFLITIIVQVIVGSVLMFDELKSIRDAGYDTTFYLMDNLDAVIKENAVLMTLITSFVMIFVSYIMMYTDKLYRDIEPFNFSGYGTLCILGITGALGISRLVGILPLDNIIGSYAETQSLISRSPIPVQILTLVFVTPIMEELFFRGVIYNRIKKYSDVIWASILTSLLFGIYHMNLVQGVYAFIMGILMCAAYYRHKSILAPMFLHICANGTAFIMSINPVSKAISRSL